MGCLPQHCLISDAYVHVQDLNWQTLGHGSRAHKLNLYTTRPAQELFFLNILNWSLCLHPWDSCKRVLILFYMKTHQLRTVVTAFHPHLQPLDLFISRKRISRDPLCSPLDHLGCCHVNIIQLYLATSQSVVVRNGCNASDRKQDYLFLFWNRNSQSWPILMNHCGACK